MHKDWPEFFARHFILPSGLTNISQNQPWISVLPGPSAINVSTLTNPKYSDIGLVISGGISATEKLLKETCLKPTVWFDNGDFGQGGYRLDQLDIFFERYPQAYYVTSTETFCENAHFLSANKDFFVKHLHRFLFSDLHNISGLIRCTLIRWQNRLLNILNWLALNGCQYVFLFGSDGAVDLKNPKNNYLLDNSGYQGGGVETLQNNMLSIERSIETLRYYWSTCGKQMEVLNVSPNSTLSCFPKITLAEVSNLLDKLIFELPVTKALEQRPRFMDAEQQSINLQDYNILCHSVLGRTSSLRSLFYLREIALEALSIQYHSLNK